LIQLNQPWPDKLARALPPIGRHMTARKPDQIGSGWKTHGPGRILRLMDDSAIKLYPDKNSGAWNWELMLRGKRIAYGESSDTQEAAYAAARQALAKERERRSKR
jgi:hypothetical protein